MLKLIRYFTLVGIYCAMAFALFSCKIYSFTGASIPPQAKTVSVAYFVNNAPVKQPMLSQLLTEALKNKLQSQTTLSLVNSIGDLDFTGEITAYSIQPMAIQANETAALNRLTITVSVKYTNSFTESQNFEASFSRYRDYDPSKNNISSIELDLIKQINDELVEDIFNKALVNW
ncbi:MAG: LptE family protein [Bacteroidota bacterium]